jgi:hypothetical protein
VIHLLVVVGLHVAMLLLEGNHADFYAKILARYLIDDADDDCCCYDLLLFYHYSMGVD